MIYALDTNIISYILRGDDIVKKRWRKEESNGNRSVIPLIVYYEARRGLLANGATTKLRAFENLCFKLGVYDLTKADTDTAAGIYAALRRSGRTVEDADLLIAAQTVSRGYTLVTNNVKHFEGIEELQLENWAE
jgi:predicted nucleic acid-binding protein